MKENGWKRTVRTVFRNYQNIYLPNVNLVRNKHILILSSQSPSPPIPQNTTVHLCPNKIKNKNMCNGVIQGLTLSTEGLGLF